MSDIDLNYDITIIGGGPGGYVAAIRASQLGFNVGLIEKENLGGVCLNWGCIPTKALLRSSEVKHLLDHSKSYGFSISNYQVNFEDIIKRSRSVAKSLSSGVEHLMKKNNINVHNGTARITVSNKNKKVVEVIDQENKVHKITSKFLIIATGATSKNLPFVSSDGKNILDYRSAMTQKELPKSLIVVGSGAIGSEFASFYNDLGCKVTIVEVQNKILPNEDHEISDFVLKSFQNRGIIIHKNCELDNVEIKSSSVKCEIKSGDKKNKLSADKLLLSVGIKPNIENLGLEKLNIKMENGFISTNELMETSENGIYAIGDVTDGPWLAHKASHEGILCVDSIKGLKTHKIKKENIPGCTYSRPQIASIGLTEKKALELNYEIKIGRFPFIGNGKAIALGESEGFVKTIFDKKTGEFLGAHLVGPEVTELIQGFAIAKKLETTEEDLMETIFPHPTLSEAMHESVLDAYNRVIHF